MCGGVCVPEGGKRSKCGGICFLGLAAPSLHVCILGPFCEEGCQTETRAAYRPACELSESVVIRWERHRVEQQLRNSEVQC